jgi:aspartate/methionine/tyrosine aminotransferase
VAARPRRARRGRARSHLHRVAVYPHNPTGATVDLGYLRDQLAVARAHDILLCSDECYQEMWFDEPAPSLLEACDGDLTGVLASCRSRSAPA